MVEQLLKYQEVDEKLRSVEDAIKNSEEYKKYAQATKFLKGANETNAQYEDRSSSLLAIFESKKAELSRALEEKQELLSSINEDEVDNKQLQYLNKMVKQLQGKLTTLESDLIKLQEEIDDLIAKYTTFRKKYKVAKEQREEYKEKYDKVLSENEGKITAIKAELEKLKKGIPDAVLQKYIEKRKDGKTRIVCKVEGGVCSSCNTELVIAEMDKLKAEKIMECPNCHKLIYIES